MKTTHIFAVLACAVAGTLVLNSCKSKDDDTTPVTTTTVPAAICTPGTTFSPDATAGPRLIFEFKFDSTQARLNNLGAPSTVPAGNGAQSPVFHLMSQHYIELANDTDPLGGGKVLFSGITTTAGGSAAINYCASTETAQGAVFFSKALSQITPGTYKWLRVSLAYQNYDITYKSSYLPGGIGTGTLASFIGYNTYVTGYKLNGHDHVPSSAAGGPGNHLQGYWGFETTVLGSSYFYDGQAPAGATTVPNPFTTSAVPAGSCVVTGQFVNSSMANAPLVITGTETSDIVITVSLSTNKSFEWHEITADGYFQPEIGEYAVDMGVRGMIPIKN